MAADINSVTIVGRLTRDAELKYTNSGSAVTTMGLAVNRSRKDGEQWVEEANFFDISLWGRRGESLNQYLQKGSRIAVTGELRQERWEQDGQKRSRVVIHASNIQLLGGDKQQSTNQNASSGQQSHSQGNNQGNNSYSSTNGQTNNGPNSANFDDQIPF